MQTRNPATAQPLNLSGRVAALILSASPRSVTPFDAPKLVVCDRPPVAKCLKSGASCRADHRLPLLFRFCRWPGRRWLLVGYFGTAGAVLSACALPFLALVVHDLLACGIAPQPPHHINQERCLLAAVVSNVGCMGLVSAATMSSLPTITVSIPGPCLAAAPSDCCSRSVKVSQPPSPTTDRTCALVANLGRHGGSSQRRGAVLTIL